METLTAREWIDLIRNVFSPDPQTDRGVLFMVDVPDDAAGDNPDWRLRREMAVQWVRDLQAARELHGWDVALMAYPNVHRNNADLPAQGCLWEGSSAPAHVRDLQNRPPLAFSQAYGQFSMWLAPTEFSATAPLKLAARTHGGFRAATMPGFCAAMIPALRLPWADIQRRVDKLKTMLDQADGARLEFRADDGSTDRLYLDLRHRSAHASGGVLRVNGTAGNLPSGEAYIVPYEGEKPGVYSLSEGVLPVEFDGEIVRYLITGNRAVDVLGTGPAARQERRKLREEPAYGNLAELGLGVLAAFGIAPIGEVLLDEKLGLHIAFGRSDHFGGQVGPANFSSPDAVVHIDRVYVSRMQPRLFVHCDLDFAGTLEPLIRKNDYVIEF